MSAEEGSGKFGAMSWEGAGSCSTYIVAGNPSPGTDVARLGARTFRLAGFARIACARHLADLAAVGVVHRGERRGRATGCYCCMPDVPPRGT